MPAEEGDRPGRRPPSFLAGIAKDFRARHGGTTVTTATIATAVPGDAGRQGVRSVRIRRPQFRSRTIPVNTLLATRHAPAIARASGQSPYPMRPTSPACSRWRRTGLGRLVPTLYPHLGTGRAAHGNRRVWSELDLLSRAEGQWRTSACADRRPLVLARTRLRRRTLRCRHTRRQGVLRSPFARPWRKRARLRRLPHADGPFSALARQRRGEVPGPPVTPAMGSGRRRSAVLPPSTRTISAPTGRTPATSAIFERTVWFESCFLCRRTSGSAGQSTTQAPVIRFHDINTQCPRPVDTVTPARFAFTPCSPSLELNARTYEIRLANGTKLRRTSSDRGRALLTGFVGTRGAPAGRRRARHPVRARGERRSLVTIDVRHARVQRRRLRDVQRRFKLLRLRVECSQFRFPRL